MIDVHRLLRECIDNLRMLGTQNMDAFRQYELHFQQIGSRINFNGLWEPPPDLPAILPNRCHSFGGSAPSD